MNRSEFQQGQGLNARQTMLHMQSAIQEAFAHVLSNYTATAAAFKLSGAVVTEQSVSGAVTVTVSAGTASLAGEPFEVPAGSIDRAVDEVAWLEPFEEYVDVIPVQNIEQVATGNQVRRVLVLNKGSNLPAPGTYVPLNAPTQTEIIEQKLQSKLLRKGVMYVIDTDDIPLIPDNWSNTGIGQPGTPAEGLLLCNGMNGTIDMRGVTPIGATLSEFSVGAGSQPAGVVSSYTVEQVVGAEGVALTVPQLPEHTHNMGSQQLGVDAMGDTNLIRSAGTGSASPTTATGGGEAHENRQPSRAVVWVKVA